MDTAKIKNIFKLFDEDVDYNYLTTFQEELDRQANLILVPTAIVALFSWLPYILLDWNLYREMPLIIIFRFGWTMAGVVALSLHFSPRFKGSNYWLLFAIVSYLELASAIIIGMVQADPAYMSGYAMLLLIIPLMPFKTLHALSMLAASLLAFIITGAIAKMNFGTWSGLYGLYNLIVTSVTASIGVFVLDNIRKVSYDKNKMNYLSNMELKVAAMEIFQINEELKKADTLKSQLLEIAAVDLKNPLKDIMECTKFLKNEAKEDEAVTRKLNTVYRSTGNMVNLITKLLKSLSLDREKLVLKKSVIHLSQLLESIIEMNKPILDKKHQKILFTAGEDCTVHGDAVLLNEVFENLLSNAVKFSYPGKSIWINVDRNDSGVTVKVRDEGPGLNEDDMKKMFARFQKLSAKPTGGESSTGLGLAITKDLIEMHDGKIRVESEPGQGCVFIVDFPKAAA